MKYLSFERVSKRVQTFVIDHNLTGKNRADTGHGWSFLERMCRRSCTTSNGVYFKRLHVQLKKLSIRSIGFQTRESQCTLQGVIWWRLSSSLTTLSLKLAFKQSPRGSAYSIWPLVVSVHLPTSLSICWVWQSVPAYFLDHGYLKLLGQVDNMKVLGWTINLLNPLNVFIMSL